MRNVGEKDFPGGEAEIWIHYTSGQKHFMGGVIPEIEKGKEVLINKISWAALGKGYALFFCKKITANDGKRVQLIGYGQELPKNASFGSIFIETRTDLYSYYMLIISAIALVALVILSVLGLIL